MTTQQKYLLLTAALLAIAASSMAAPQSTAPQSSTAGKAPALSQNVLVQSNVPYAEVGGKPLLLDVVRPKRPATGPLPALVFVHGGGWYGGSKSSGIPQLALLVASGNYIGFSVEYRLTSAAIWPAQIYDCKAAIRWVRANAQKYGVDPNKVGVWGGSAGGHLVTLLGTSGDVKDLEGAIGCSGQSSRVSCVVDFCGPSDFLAYAQFKRHALLASPALPQSPESRLFGGPIEQKRKEAIAASPVTYISPDDPPFLIVHGTKDDLVPLEQSELLEVALRKAGVDVTLVKIEGGGHVFAGPEVGMRVGAFFAKHLRGQNVEISNTPIR